MRYSPVVHVITKKRLAGFAVRYPAARDPLLRWYRIVSQTDFASFAAIRSVFRAADQVGRLTVFDLGSNKFRIIAAVHYNRRRIYIRHVLTHSEYDKGKWKER
ncbi:MAG: type II toxin-antitoxin system HigB family toxin [Pseudomonadota bacterium]